MSDSFPEGAVSDIEVTVRMINVNFGNSQELLTVCKPLSEYSWLVAEIRKNNKTGDENGADSAIDMAIDAMPAEFVIKPFLEAHRAEVKGMLLAEYNQAETMELFKEEGREEGIEEGTERERVRNIQSMMETLKLTAKQAMDALRIPLAEQSKYMRML